MEHPDFDFKVYESSPAVYGLVTTKDPMAEALDEYLTKDMDATGAMHHGVLSMLRRIHETGYDAFIAKAEAEIPDRVCETSEEQIIAEVDAASAEWQAKLNSGYDPQAELLKHIPANDIIHVDANDPESVRRAGNELKRRLDKL